MDVREHTLTTGGKMGADGKAEFFMESAGWYLHLSNVSIYLGREKPDIQKGDWVRLTVEKQETDYGDKEAKSDVRREHGNVPPDVPAQ